MFLGHYAAALAAKRADPDLSLGTAVLAAQLTDLLWPAFLLLGLERVRITPGYMAANSLEFVHYPITHSLLAVIGWAALAGVVYYLSTRRRRGAWLVAALVLSHWLIDVPVHAPDLPLWPGSHIEVGGGLWDSVSLTLALELGLLAVGLALYLHSTRPRDAIGRWGLAAMIAILATFWLSGFFAPPPPSQSALAVGGLFLWLFVPWSYWIDQHRDPGARSRTVPRRGVRARSRLEEMQEGDDEA